MRDEYTRRFALLLSASIGATIYPLPFAFVIFWTPLPNWFGLILIALPFIVIAGIVFDVVRFMIQNENLHKTQLLREWTILAVCMIGIGTNYFLTYGILDR